LASTPGRLEALLMTVTASVLGVTVLALLNRHGLLHIASLSSVAQRAVDEGDPSVLMRLRATGIFNDPNDYSLVLVLCLCVGVHRLTDPRAGHGRWLVLAPMAIFAYALLLTHSRGGLLSAGAAAGAYASARFGGRNAIPIMALLALLMLAPFW